MNSTLTKSQMKVFGPRACRSLGYGRRAMIKATVRYDDREGNGHNTFSIVGEIYVPGKNDCEAGGMLSEEIAQYFPELAPFMKWHLVSTDGPMHYIANSLYWAGKTKWEKPNLSHFRSTAVWPEATEETMALPETELTAQLEARLPALLADFKQAAESLGFTY